MDLLHKVKDAITGRNSKSKQPSRGSDPLDYGSRNSSKAGSFRDEYARDDDFTRASGYGAGDYGSRFESNGVRPRPGTYGSGSYGSASRGHRVSYRSGSAHDYRSATDRHGSQSLNINMSARIRQGFGGAGVAAGSSSSN